MVGKQFPASAAGGDNGDGLVRLIQLGMADRDGTQDFTATFKDGTPNRDRFSAYRQPPDNSPEVQSGHNPPVIHPQGGGDSVPERAIMLPQNIFRGSNQGMVFWG